MAGAKAAIIARLKARKRVTLSDLEPLCASRKAAITMIYRLREEGYEIRSTPPKSAAGEYTYTLTKVPGSLARYRHPDASRV